MTFGALAEKRRVTFAYSNANGKAGRRDYFNCWGATLFVLKQKAELHWINAGEMNDWLEGNTHRIHRPRKFGDILVVTGWGLEHTAVYLGKGKYFHKKGSSSAEITTLAGVRKTYRGRYSFRRMGERPLK